jgi:hypothetical protein
VLIPLLATAGCGLSGGALTPASPNVAAARSLLNSKYAGDWWSRLFGGKNDMPTVGTLQLATEIDVSSIQSATQKTAALAQLSSAGQTVDQLRADGAFSQADANKVLAAISDIESQVKSKP